ncbi:uncharacterized protein MELLADRAFT_109368 [Melampsora larici-populina 98AG31]|uniref:Domain of unknown function at the cortex 1 domain-containing protein n=1 Tax=Melampsora larici-populina (strain 98AG31 / pathotype 3-4-7) TaxID=747676 RepID=F4RW86_MELLP|nr:uncharacterized protein MELLADRAFT_109368 [Melampsora larici-populina 98AG31]EGG03239.1 hypothetical protein MELLADRAFT_109368 [Melampsora larici-populina 98AG31]
MNKKLRISIGSSRDTLQIAHVNDSTKPTIIDSDIFVGRVLVKIKDFDGITPDGSNPIHDHVYFDGRSRKFDIQIEGRFKRREGVPLYSGEEVHFGSDFDHLVEFPKSAFNAGMRVARWIDPNTFYDLSPSSGRPFIMSPYLACMNTLCAWPSPSRMSDALVCLRQSNRGDEDQDLDDGDDMVPMEQVDRADIGKAAGSKKIGRHTKRYWRFIGLKGDGDRIDAFLEKNKELLAERPVQEPLSVSQHSRKLSEHEEYNEDDDDDALSCRAPSSHATYSTALEGRPPMSSASSYRFSPRIFPRHQISFGAGMRDLYQDAETEATEREGEARAQQVMDTLGEEDVVMCPPMPPRLESHQLHDSEEKKLHKVKSRLKKLKTAFQKLTPAGLSSSTSSSSLGGSSSSSPPTNCHNKFTTVLHHSKSTSKSKSNTVTVTRAASRTLPFTRRRRDPSSSTNTNEPSPSPPQKVTADRSSTVLARPLQSQPETEPIETSNNNRIRSTSFDNGRNTQLESVKIRERPQTLFISPTIITDPDVLEKSEQVIEGEPRVSSPSTFHHSDDTSSTSTSFSEHPSPARQVQPQEERSSSYSSNSTVLKSVSSAEEGVETDANRTPELKSISMRPTGSYEQHLTVPKPMEKVGSSSSESESVLSETSSQNTNRGVGEATEREGPTQKQIDAAPALKDVEKGDLMFGDMLNFVLDDDPFQDQVHSQLGPWRFRNPTTDILEDNTFVFLNKSVDVQKRRKYFSESYGKHRKEFIYDPDVVYATSFFSPFMNFNTFDLAIGPVKMNVAKIFGDMPIRYTLRSTRISEGGNEEEIFVTIAFELVDVEE